MVTLAFFPLAPTLRPLSFPTPEPLGLKGDRFEPLLYFTITPKRCDDASGLKTLETGVAFQKAQAEVVGRRQW